MEAEYFLTILNFHASYNIMEKHGIMHQSIPPAPMPPSPSDISIFFHLDGKYQEKKTKKKGKCPNPRIPSHVSRL